MNSEPPPTGLGADGGGVVVITRFECESLFNLALIWISHLRMKPVMREHVGGFVGAAVMVDYETRVLLNVSLWSDLESVRSMGRVRRHVDATRLPSKLGVSTRAGIFEYSGDWRRVLFNLQCSTVSPINAYQE